VEALRKPPLVVALAIILLVVCLEIGATFFIRGAGGSPPADAPPNFSLTVAASGEATKPPGLGVPYLALIDGIVLFTTALVAVGILIPERIQGRIQGIITLIFSLLIIIGGIILIILAITLLLVMIALLFSVPFGTIVYVVLFGFFDRGRASAVLAILMFLKIAFIVCLLLAQQRFVQNKGFVLLVLTSLLGNIIVSFLQGIVPRVLVSITDAIAAIILGIIAVIWAIVLLVGSIVSIVKAIRPAG
jgi:hypothetical protein